MSPQNNEYVTSFAYKQIGKAYYLPPEKKETLETLKALPDSALTREQYRKKTALMYIDSLSAVASQAGLLNTTAVETPSDTQKITNRQFFQYQPAAEILEKENRYGYFLRTEYPDEEKDSLQKRYDWNKPGKWIAYKELAAFLKGHTGLIPLGTGIAGFSSRAAFKATGLNMAGSYPVKYRYINPWFRSNYFYLFLYYHSQIQAKHAAANTPDSVYSQLLGEYGIAGVLAFSIFYVGYFLRRSALKGPGLGLLLMLLAGLLVEYWFEQLSIVILFELLMFLNMKQAGGEAREV